MSTALLPAPPGVSPNFSVWSLSQTQVHFIVAYSLTLAIASATLGIRLYTRISIMKSFGLDDVAIIISYILSVAYFAISLDCIRYGFGRHLWEVTAQQMGTYLTRLSPMVGTYAWAPAFTKLSILILLHRLNPDHHFRLACYFVALIIIVYTLTITLIIALPCIPTNASNAACLNKCGLWQAIFNILTDAAILILPLSMLHQLKLPLRQKLAVASIFSTGIFVIIICIVRITYITALQDNPDALYTQGRAAVWSSVEINIGIFCNTLVVLRPFVRQHFPTLFSSHLLSDDQPPSDRDLKPNTNPWIRDQRRKLKKLQGLDSMGLESLGGSSSGGLEGGLGGSGRSRGVICSRGTIDDGNGNGNGIERSWSRGTSAIYGGDGGSEIAKQDGILREFEVTVVSMEPEDHARSVARSEAGSRSSSVRNKLKSWGSCKVGEMDRDGDRERESTEDIIEKV